MKISSRLTLIIIILFIGFLFIAGFTTFAITKLVNSMEVLKNGYEYLTELKSCDQLLLRQLATGQSLLLSGAETVDGDILVELRLSNTRLMHKVEGLETRDWLFRTGGNLEIIRRLTEFYGLINSELITRLFNHETVDPVLLSAEISGTYSELSKALIDFELIAEEDLSIVSRRGARLLQNLSLMFLIISICFSLLLLLVYFFMRASVIKPIVLTGLKLKELNDGGAHLDFRFQKISNDEVGELSTQFNRFMETLSIIMEEIRTSSEVSTDLGFQLDENLGLTRDSTQSLLSTAENLRRYFEDLGKTINDSNLTALRVEEQARENEVISEYQNRAFGLELQKMIDIINDISRIRARAEDTLSEAEALRKDARAGMEVIRNLANLIDGIVSNTENVLSINDVINDVSDKTAILGINAAIEASRAGVSGLGFKVVAGEINRLAVQVKGNADQISRHIHEIINSIQDLKSESSKGMDGFLKIENSSVDLYDVIVEMAGELAGQEDKGTRLISGVRDIQESSEKLIKSIRILTSDINEITGSVKSLNEDYSPALQGLIQVGNEALFIDELTETLNKTSFRNRESGEALIRCVEHFSLNKSSDR